MEKFYMSKNKKDNQRKGLKQLLNTLKYLDDYKYQFDKNLTINNTKLYPIIIYTDSFCSMPGVNDYLNQLFHEELKKMEWNKNCKLRDLTLISLETMVKHMQNFRTRKFKLSNMIDDYHKYLFNSRNRNLNQYPSFDIFINDSKYSSFHSKNFVSEAFSCFDLKTDFPGDTTSI
ncbi:MAG: hypothetical protein HYZ42_04035 [Bacteroidetes bacterium]|nr:hypothetical protein [Bacteroidota bacterium]